LRRQNQSAPPTAARAETIAPLLGRFDPSTVPGTASFAFFFRTRFAVSQVSQPSMALRLFTMLMR
jgi:hypothetical protein